MKKILVVAMGPMEVLSGLVSLGENLYSQKNKITFLIGNYISSNDLMMGFFSKEILKPYHNISVCESDGIESELYQKKITKHEFLNKLHRKIGGHFYDEIYVTYNRMPLNEGVFRLNPKSHKIITGDAFGRIVPPNKPSIVNPFFGNDYPKVDEIKCIYPIEIEKDAFLNIPITVVSSDYFKKIIYYQSGRFELFIKSKIGFNLEKFNSNKISIICTSSGTEAGFFSSIEDESMLDFEFVKDFLSREKIYFIKGHPREVYNQSGRLNERLYNNGFKSFCLKELNFLPVQFIIAQNFIEDFLPNISSSGYLIPLINTSACISYPIDQIESVRKFANANYTEKIINEIFRSSILLDRVRNNNLSPVTHKEIKLEHLNINDSVHLSCGVKNHRPMEDRRRLLAKGFHPLPESIQERYLARLSPKSWDFPQKIKI